MIYCPEKYKKNLPDINDELLSIRGELEDEQAKITLVKFLRYNLGIAVDWVAGFKMTPHQEIALKAFFLRNYSMCVWGRGASKSTMAAVACFFLPIFEPNTNIVIAGPTFRTARNIFSYMEKMEKSPEAILLKQCLGIKSKRNDLFEWEINGGSVRAIPLNGEKIRGLRANVLILDEFLLLSEDIIKNVLMPFLVAPMDIKERIIINEKETELIRQGKMKEEERTIFPNKSRMICLSSASYTFEYLYQVYKEWEKNIYSDKMEDATYCLNNVSYEALPVYMVEKSVIEEAKSGDELHPSFKREYCAEFVDGSDSYFSAKKMHDLTIEDGQRPTTLLKGRPGKKYIVSVDPNFSQSASADFFAMAVLEINEENNTVTLVNNYGVAGVELRKHIEYFYYLLTCFNVVLVIADNADGNFIQSANESAIFQSNKLKLDFIDYDGSRVGEEYMEMIKEVRKQYNLEARRICIKQVFNQESIRRMNEQLQTWINTKKVWFGSKLTQHEEDFEPAANLSIPIELEKGDSVVDFIATQDEMIPQVKKQCSLIEIRTSPTGGQIFDLPQTLKRNTSSNRARKDNYTALLLGAEGMKAYIDLMRQVPKEATRMFTPTMFGQSTLTR